MFPQAPSGRELDAKITELNEKDADLETFIIVVCTVSGVSLCGTAAFVLWFFLDQKRRI
ncbi:MAG: hypothetical protein J6D21_05100 [Clostridia bacterium]|nr:hypothetical protein [Clostridia bacterium]